jgi:hypothetical protein
MKNLKLMMMTLMMSLLSMVSFGQDRVNAIPPKISTNINSKLTNAIGWMLNPEGEWISRPNKIPSFVENRNKTSIDYGMFGLGVDNFISYEFRDIKINDTNYVILLKRYTNGAYKYPTIMEGFEKTNCVEYYVLNKNELQKLKEFKNDTINYIELNVLYSNGFCYINANTYIQDVEKEIIKQIQKPSTFDKKLIFHFVPYKNKNIVQFQIYSIWSSSTYKSISGIIKEYKVKDENGKYSWDTKQIYGTNELFKYCYFETSYTNFITNFINK